MKNVLILGLLAFTGAMANTLPSVMGVEVVRRDDGEVEVREVPKSLDKRTCTNCVHVGGTCTIGEGNCYTSEHGRCTDCGKRGVICVDSKGGSCKAP